MPWSHPPRGQHSPGQPPRPCASLAPQHPTETWSATLPSKDGPPAACCMARQQVRGIASERTLGAQPCPRKGSAEGNENVAKLAASPLNWHRQICTYKPWCWYIFFPMYWSAQPSSSSTGTRTEKPLSHVAGQPYPESGRMALHPAQSASHKGALSSSSKAAQLAYLQLEHTLAQHESPTCFPRRRSGQDSQT